MTAFWKHLPRAVIDAYSLRLAHDTMFLSDPDLGNALYVRDDYRSMLATVEKQFATRRTRKLVISGNPGIGKSWFGLYFLHYLATTAPNTPVVWESIRKKRRFLFRDGLALRGDLSAFLMFLITGMHGAKNAWHALSSLNIMLWTLPQVHRR